MRQLVYHVASTLDNFICHEDGSIAGFPDGDHVGDYLEHLKQYDTAVMGKATYEFGYRYGMKPGEAPYPHMQHYIFSKTLKFDRPPDPRIHLVHTDPGPVVASLKQQSGADIYLCGGSALAQYLFAQKLIDKLVVKLAPVVFGRGKRMFGESDLAASLKLLSTKVYASGVVLLTYDVMYRDTDFRDS